MGRLLNKTSSSENSSVSGRLLRKSGQPDVEDNSGTESNVNTAVQTITKEVKEPSLLKKFWDGFISRASSDRERIQRNMQGINTVSGPDPKALQAELITGPSKDEIYKQHEDLLKMKDTIDHTDENQVNDFNERINKINTDISQYEKTQKAYEVISGKGIIPVEKTPVINKISTALSNIYNAPAEIIGEELGKTKFFRDLAESSDQGQLQASYVEELAKRLQFGQQFITGISGGLVKPNYQGTPQDIPTKLLAGLTELAGGLEGIKLINTSASKVISAFPKGKEVLDVINKATEAGEPFWQRFAVSGAQNIGGGAILGVLKDNEKSLVENALDTAGEFAAFHAIAYPIASFFKPVLQKIGEGSLNINSRRVANETLRSMENEDVSKTLWFRNPKSPDQLIKIQAKGIKVVDKTSPEARGIRTPEENIPVLTDAKIEAFQQKPSLFKRLVEVVQGKLKSGTEVKFNEVKSPEDVERISRDIQEGKIVSTPSRFSSPKIDIPPEAIENIAVNLRRKEPTANQEKIGSKLEVPKDLEPLAQEARKYKSAEEFVKSQSKLFRGDSGGQLGAGTDLKKLASRPQGLSMTIDEKVAKKFMQGKDIGSPDIFKKTATLSNFGIKPGAKILDSKTLGKDFEKVDFEGEGYIDERDLETIKYARDNEYDILDFSNDTRKLGGHEKEMIVLNPDILYTKEELTDFYNKTVGIDTEGKTIDNTEYEKPKRNGRGTEEHLPRSGDRAQHQRRSGSQSVERNDNGSRVEEARRFSRDSGGDKESAELVAKDARSILKKESTPITETTFTVLKAWGFSDDLITNLKKSHADGGIKNIKAVESDEFVSAYRIDNDTLTLNIMEKDHRSYLSGDIVNHEISGHAWYHKLSLNDRLSFYENLKQNRKIIKESWENKDNPYKTYWQDTLREILKAIDTSSNTQVADDIIKFMGLYYDPTISLDTFLDRSLNIDKTIEAINRELANRGYAPITLKADMTSAVQEHVAMIAENASELTGDDVSIVGRYIDDIQNETLVYGENGVNNLVYQGERDLTLKTLEKLKGRESVSKQFISDLTNSGDIKQVERDIIRDVLAQYPDGSQIPIKEFAESVKVELLPLNRVDQSKKGGIKDYENIALPDDLRGNVANYAENIYVSPIKTSAGQIHFPRGTDNYFGHTRIEDMTDELNLFNDTRRVIEVQSDLYQKGNLDNEGAELPKGLNKEDIAFDNVLKQYRINYGRGTRYGTKKELEDLIEQTKTRDQEVVKLQQYNNPSAHFRMVREEIRQAAKDGKTKLQFPTGETAMKIEGLGENQSFSLLQNGREDRIVKLTPENLKMGEIVKGNGQNWVITEVLEDGKFKAVYDQKLEKSTIESLQKGDRFGSGVSQPQSAFISNYAETFDISGNIDTNNPIYRFYEKDLGRYLKNQFDAKPVTDDKGVSWYEVDIKPEMATEPVMAFRRGTTDIEQLRRMLDREQQSLDALVANPEAHAMAYPGRSAEQYKAKIAELKQRIAEAKNPVFDTGSKLDDLRATLANAENRTGVKVSIPRNEPLPKEFEDRQIELQIRRESLNQNPLRKLSKYTNKKTGELPEVLGEGKAQFKRMGDELITSGEFDQFKGEDGRLDTETIRARYQDYIEERNELIKEEEEFKDDISEFKEMRRGEILDVKDEKALDKISDKAVKAISRELELENRRKEFNIAQKKVDTEFAKAQDKKNKLKAERDKPVESTKPSVIKSLNPKSHLDPETQKIYTKFANQMAEANVVGIKYKNKFKEADKLGAKAYDMYQLIGNAPGQKEIQNNLTRIYQHAKTHGFPDLPHRTNYLPQMYEGTHDKIPALDARKQMATERLTKEGATKEEIEKYIKALEENQDQSVHLKKNAFFQKYKTFSSYAEAAEFGYYPKYTKISDLLGVYEKLELETTATRTLIDDLAESGKIQVEQVAPHDWQPIKYGPHGIKGYWAPPKIANFLDNLFQGHENMGTTDAVFLAAADLSRFGQNLALSGGIPFTSVNFFTFGILNKELLRGNLKAFKAFTTANSDKATVESLQNDYKYIEMMVRNGIPFRSISGVKKENYETIKKKWGKLKKGVKENPFKPSSYSPFFQIIGQSVDQVFGKKTFDNFMPLLHVQVFKDSYNALVKAGISDEEAQMIAASMTRMSQGIVEDLGRSQMTQDKLTALFFAPVYRESIINTLWNTGKSATTKARNPMYRYNRNLLAGMIVMFGVYDLINKKLNGHHIWENPQSHKADLRIPLPNGQVGYVPFMPGFLALPRTIIGGIQGVIAGDVKEAASQASGVTSMVFNTTVEVLTNRDYFGNDIYKEGDSRSTKLAKVAKYIGLEFNHPYIKMLVNQIGDNPKPVYQAIIVAAELPLKFSTEEKEDVNKIYAIIDKQVLDRQKVANIAEDKWKQLKSLPEDEAVTEFDNIIKNDPTLAQRLLDIHKDEQLGLTSKDRAIKQLGVENGERAKYIAEQFNLLTTDEEKGTLWEEYTKKKLITKDVAVQLSSLLSEKQ